MARALMGKNGIWIAQPGRDVSDGEQFLNFSPSCISMGIYTRGAVLVSGGGFNTGAPGPYNNRYRRMVVSLGKTFASPPIVIFQAKWGYENTCYLPTRALVSSEIVSGTVYYGFEPLFVEVSTTQMIFWNIFSEIVSFQYLVLENAL